MTWIIYEFCYWKETKSRSSDPLWNNYIPRDIWIFRYKHKRQRLVCILRKYKCLVGYSKTVLVPKWSAGLPKMFEKLGSIFLDATRHFFADLVGFPKMFCISNRALFPCLHIASSKHEEGWENSPNPPNVKMRLCKHGKVLYYFYRIILIKIREIWNVTTVFTYSHLNTPIDKWART